VTNLRSVEGEPLVLSALAQVLPLFELLDSLQAGRKPAGTPAAPGAIVALPDELTSDALHVAQCARTL
jgi:hypothetical protein